MSASAIGLFRPLADVCALDSGKHVVKNKSEASEKETKVFWVIVGNTEGSEGPLQQLRTIVEDRESKMISHSNEELWRTWNPSKCAIHFQSFASCRNLSHTTCNKSNWLTEISTCFCNSYKALFIPRRGPFGEGDATPLKARPSAQRPPREGVALQDPNPNL